MKMVDRKGAVHDVPDDQVQSSFQSGQFGFVDGTIPIITGTGEAGRIKAEDADAAFGGGARVALPGEIKTAERHEKYGSGFGNVSAAAGEGFARGLTGGLSDPLAIGVAKHLFGEEAATHVREHLAGEKEEHGIVAGGAELGGMAVPLLIPGGAAVEGAGLAARGAEGASLIGKAAEGAEALAGAAKSGEAATEAGRRAMGEVFATARAEGRSGAAVDAAAEAAGEAARSAAAGTAEGAPEAARAAAQAMGAADASRAAQVGHGLGQSVRALGVVPRGISTAGEITERAISSIIGREAGNAAARSAQKIIAKAGGAAAEGALFGVGNEIDEAALGDHELNGEKLLAAAGHGAILAGAGGGILTGAGELAREVAGRSAPLFRKLAGINAWKAASPTKGLSEKALLRVKGGAAAVGQTVIDRGILDGASNVEELYANTERVLKGVGKDLEVAYGTSGGTVTRAELEAAWDSHIAPLEKKTGHGSIVAALKESKADFFSKLDAEILPKVEADVAAKAAPRTSLFLTPEETAKFQQMSVLGNAAKMEEHGLEFAPDMRVRFKTAPPVPEGKGFEGVAKVVNDTPIPVQKLIEQRQAIGDLAYKEAKQLDPKMRVEQLREIYGDLAAIENTSMDEASKRLGEGVNKAEIEKLRGDYQKLSIYKEALQKSNARYATNRNLSMSDYMIAMGAVASGHPLGAAAALGHKVLRERGNAWAARYLDKLATLSAIERASSKVDRDISRGLGDFFRKGEAAPPRLRARVFSGPREEEYNSHVDPVARATAHADAHADHVESIADSIGTHAPETATAFQRTTLAATAYMASQIPSGHKPIVNSLSPNLEPPRVSEMDKIEYINKGRIKDDPVGTTFDKMSRGMLTRDDVESLKTMYPKIYGQIRDEAMQELASQTEPMPFAKRIQLGTLLDVPADQALAPLFVASMQQTFAGQTEKGEPGPRSKPSAPKRMLKSSSGNFGLAGSH